jgi:outer membrane protein
VTKSKAVCTILPLFLAVLFVSAAWAQQATKIGVINSQEVLEKSVEGKKVLARLQEQDKKNQALLAKTDDDIRALETKLSTQRLTLSDEALVQLSSDLDKKKKERTRSAEDATRDIQELQQRLYLKLQSELLTIIDGIGKEKGFDLILDLGKSGAVYFNPVTDVTAEVIKRYDASKATPPAK